MGLTPFLIMGLTPFLLTASSDGSVTTTYAYDFDGQRVSKSTSATTTVYANDLYNITGSTTVKHIYANDELVATIETDNGTTSTQYIHPDHLGGTHLVTDSGGALTEQTSYYPFGEQRINSGTLSEQIKYTGHEYDTESELSYMGARYYDGQTGRFTAQDPANLDGRITKFLRDPQQLNTYSYARNNPLIFVDDFGESIRAVNRPVTFLGVTIGAHSFVEITDNPNINNGQRTTLGGYTTNFITGDLFKGENYHTDYNLSEDQYLSTHDITAPTPYTQQGFEEKVYESYQNLDSSFGAYSPFGGDLPNGQGNSGNVFNQILSDAGLPQSQINSYKTTGYYDAGVGRNIPTNRVQSLNTQISNLKTQVRNLQEQVRKKFEKKDN